MHFGESLHIFIKYVTTRNTNTITFNNNILSFTKDELVKIWNELFNNKIQWTSITRSFVNYDIKSVTPKDIEDNIKQYKFPSHFTIDTILIRPSRSKNIKNQLVSKHINKKQLVPKHINAIKKRVHFNDNIIEINHLDMNKELLNHFQTNNDLIIYKEFNYDNKVQILTHPSFSKVPF